MDERLPEPGWYPDPAGGSALRYWDGQRWASSSGDRLSADTHRETPDDATQPIDPRDPPPAPNQADAWESYPSSGTYARGPFRPLAIVVLLVVVAGAVLAFALARDGDDADAPGDGQVADGSSEAAGERDGDQSGADDPADDRGQDDEGGTGTDDGTEPDAAGDEPEDAADGPGGEAQDGEPDTDEGPVVLDGRCEVPRDQVGDAEVSELHAWDFEACDLAPIDPGDGEQLIVITASLDGSTVSEAAAQETAGERELLWSSHYPALSPGFWVVYLGPFDDEEDAEEAADEAGGGAYLRRLTGQES